MPVAAAVALLCAPLAAQSRPPESNPKRLIEKADRLAWLYNWYLAGPIYAEAENDAQLRLWILDAKGAVDLEVNVTELTVSSLPTHEVVQNLNVP